MKKTIFLVLLIVGITFAETFNCCQLEYPLTHATDWKGCSGQLNAVYRNGKLSGSLSTYVHTKTHGFLDYKNKNKNELIENKRLVAGSTSNPIAISEGVFEYKQYIFSDPDNLKYPYLWVAKIDYFYIELTTTEINKIRFRDKNGNRCLKLDTWK